MPTNESRVTAWRRASQRTRHIRYVTSHRVLLSPFPTSSFPSSSFPRLADFSFMPPLARSGGGLVPRRHTHTHGALRDVTSAFLSPLLSFHVFSFSRLVGSFIRGVSLSPFPPLLRRAFSLSLIRHGLLSFLLSPPTGWLWLAGRRHSRSKPSWAFLFF